MSGTRPEMRRNKSERTAPNVKKPARRARGRGHDRDKGFARSVCAMGLMKLATVAGRVHTVMNHKQTNKTSSETPKNEPQSTCDAWGFISVSGGNPKRAKLM